MPQNPDDFARAIGATPVDDFAQSIGATPTEGAPPPPKQGGTVSWIKKQVEGALGLPQGAIDGTPHVLKGLLDLAAKHPAATGAMIAGAATAPLTGGMSLPAAAGFSGLMAGGGAAAGLLAHDAANMDTPGNVPTGMESGKQILTQGALGAGGEVVGRGLQAVSEKAAPVVSEWLYKLGLKPSKTLSTQFPTAAATGLAEDLVPTEAAIQSRLSQVEGELSASVAQQAAPVAPSQIANQARAFVLSKANLTGPGGRGMQAADVQKVNQLVGQYLKENASPLSLADTLGQKRAEQALASAAYKTEARGGEINQIEALWHQGVANAARKEVVTRVPEAADQLATEQGLLGLKAMQESAAHRSSSVSPVTAAAVLGATLAGHPEGAMGYAALTAAMHSPTLTGAMGLATQKLGRYGASSLTPAVMKALAAAYGGTQTEGGW